MSSNSPHEGFRFKLRRRLDLFRQRSDNSSPEILADDSAITASPNTSSTYASSARHTGNATPSETAINLNQTGGSTNLTTIPMGVLAPRNGSPSATISITAVTSPSAFTTEVVTTPKPGSKVAIIPSDLWSKAYQEAIQSMGQDVDITILKGESIAELFKELNRVDKDATAESAFLRGH
ncbi:hypothetical protein CEP51_004283 [Fusarium floridanum]|uniref:Uncharacterized protein n=1 Tax=Fusarium floridanum TaxID=1325733 RepID=A0A428S238_9HYPO|nr:hypothetical protein CEP51_004283 [Fusarium floridanum]